jgi:aminopeptidase YwaD
MHHHSACVLLLLLVGGGCDPGHVPPQPTRPDALATTLSDLAALGQKRVGTDPGRQAGDYVTLRMKQIGLHDVHGESFQFPRHDLLASALAVTVDGALLSPGFDVFEGSGSGHVAGPVVWVGSAADADLSGVDLTGRIALVDRNNSYHRSTQYRNVIAKGALAMLYTSAAPDNLRQIGSVRRDWVAVGPIPALTLGADDGRMMEFALAGGTCANGMQCLRDSDCKTAAPCTKSVPRVVTAKVDVDVQTTPASGNNVVGRIPGKRPEQIVLGAHYDTWFTGSSDNGGGVATLLALADRRVRQDKPQYTLVFVAYDGEEVSLFGGYDYLRKHHVVAGDPILAVLNFEIPSAKGSLALGLARSNLPAFDDALKGADLNLTYSLYTSLDVVPMLFGGIIPTDIQGIYRSGVPTVSTAVDSPYYHTSADTPDKVDIAMLAPTVDAFDAALATLLGDDAMVFENMPDPKLWLASATVQPRNAGDPIAVDVTVTDALGTPQAMAPVGAALLYDDFFRATSLATTTDAGGKATFQFAADVAALGSGNRYLHITSGPKYPLVERVVAVQ